MFRNISLLLLLGATAFPLSASALIDSDLTHESEGAQVVELQSMLQRDGYYYAPVPTGYFGERSYDAVMNFQQAHDIKMTGYFGEMTRAKFNQLYGSGGAVLGASTSTTPSPFPMVMMKGESSDAIKVLQSFLTTWGYFDDAVSGYYGPKTVVAVKKFQTANDLKSTGNVNEKTLVILNKLATESN
jgi:N-acetylmuramoyl-L-alanine amidase